MHIKKTDKAATMITSNTMTTCLSPQSQITLSLSPSLIQLSDNIQDIKVSDTFNLTNIFDVLTELHRLRMSQIVQIQLLKPISFPPPYNRIAVRQMHKLLDILSSLLPTACNLVDLLGNSSLSGSLWLSLWTGSGAESSPGAADSGIQLRFLARTFYVLLLPSHSCQVHSSWWSFQLLPWRPSQWLFSSTATLPCTE